MEHKMGLFEKPFQSIVAGKKIVEVRLNDEKRRKLKVGDTLLFSKLPDNEETLLVKVNELRGYPTFKEMYESISSSEFDADGETVEEMVNQTYQVYTPESEKTWGTLAITVEVIDNQSEE